jgi:hypothetical protein
MLTVSQCLFPASESDLLLICFALDRALEEGGITKASKSSSRSLTKRSRPIITEIEVEIERMRREDKTRQDKGREEGKKR